MDFNKILITGGAGFIGTNLSNYLIKKNYEVFIIDDLSVGKFKNINKGAKFKKLSILNKSGLNKYLKVIKPDVVFHFAALNNIHIAEKIRKVNILGTKNIVSVSINNNVKKIIFASSASVYGDAKSIPTKETDKLSPINIYGESKIKGEEIVKKFPKYTILRFSNVYGSGQSHTKFGGVRSIFEYNLSKNKTLKINGDGNQTRDFINVKKVVKACYKSMFLDKSLILNISSGKETSINSLVPKGAKVIHIKNKNTQIKRSCLDNTLAKNYKLVRTYE